VDALTFIAEMVKALAWPSMALALVLLLRKPIAELIPLLTRLKYKDLELEFGRRVAEVKAEAGEELPPPQTPAPLEAAEEQTLLELAKLSPRAAITEVWRQVELAALDGARRNDIYISPSEATSPARVLRALERHRVIDAGKLGLVHDLRGLRNQAVHSPDFAVTSASALEYVQLARRVVDFLKTARRGDAGPS
jgi:hypothetical protein